MNDPRQLRCVMAQLNLVVGDVEGNTSRIIAAATEARDQWGAHVVMLPELAVSGYPPEDLLFHSGMRTQVAALDRSAEDRGARNHADRGLSGIRRGADLQFRHRDSRWRRISESPQGLPAQLPRIRRKALFHSRYRTHRRRVERRAKRGFWCAKTYGSPNPRGGPAGPAHR